MDLLLPSIPKGTYFELIPLELIREILLYLEYQDLDVLGVNEDLFWRLKISEDLPNIDLDFIIKFLSLKRKNPKPITIERRQVNNTNLVIITDNMKYKERVYGNQDILISIGGSPNDFRWEKLDQISYLVGIQFSTINIYKAIYYHFTQPSITFKSLFSIPAEINFFLLTISSSMTFSSKSDYSDMIRQYLRMGVHDKIIFSISVGRFAYLLPTRH